MPDSFVKRSALSRNKIFALAFRAFAFLFAVWGILAITGVFKNKFHPMALMMYTIQSNILVAVFFAILLAKTILHIRGSEQQPESPAKPYGFFPRLSAIVTLAIFVTMLIYWLILAPIAPGTGIGRFLAPDNLAVHLITPLLMLADYLIFTSRGKLKKYDPLLCAIIPYIYLGEVMTLGLTRTVKYDFMGSDSHFPYIFLDVDRFGAWVILMVAGITIIFLVIAFSWRYLDKKLGQRNRK
jgi:hypothetical protein